MNCPFCDTPIYGLVTRGPTDHFLAPCDCRVSSVTAREFADADRGRGVVTDGGRTELRASADRDHPEGRRPVADYEAVAENLRDVDRVVEASVCTDARNRPTLVRVVVGEPELGSVVIGTKCLDYGLQIEGARVSERGNQILYLRFARQNSDTSGGEQ